MHCWCKADGHWHWHNNLKVFLLKQHDGSVACSAAAVSLGLASQLNTHTGRLEESSADLIGRWVAATRPGALQLDLSTANVRDRRIPGGEGRRRLPGLASPQCRPARPRAVCLALPSAAYFSH